MAVKGISRQVIVLQPQDPQLFDQVIFILKDNAAGVSEEQLLQEANRLIRYPRGNKKGRYRLQEFLLLGVGATFMGVVWLISTFF